MKFERKTQWHKWFAWYPVKVSRTKSVWLEVVERRWVPASVLYHYKEIQ